MKKAWEMTVGDFLDAARLELGVDFKYMLTSLIDEHYEEIIKHVKSGGTISYEVYISLEKGKRYHFCKHFGMEV